MARYPWFPLWIDDLATSGNFQDLKWSTQGVYLNVLRHVRREPHLLGLICFPNGKPVTIKSLCGSISKVHPERAKAHIDKLFDVGLLEWDKDDENIIRVSKFKEKVTAAVSLAYDLSETGTKRGQNGEKPRNVDNPSPKSPRSVPVLSPKCPPDMYKESEPDPETEKQKAAPPTAAGGPPSSPPETDQRPPTPNQAEGLHPADAIREEDPPDEVSVAVQNGDLRLASELAEKHGCLRHAQKYAMAGGHLERATMLTTKILESKTLPLPSQKNLLNSAPT